jgi:hypothetical protein
MNRFLCCLLLLLGVALFAAPAQAQYFYQSYYAPAVVAPVPVYPNRVVTYYAPATVPIAAPLPVTSYYAPAPVVPYYAPTAVIAPVYAAPVVVRARYTPFRTTYRVYGY